MGDQTIDILFAAIIFSNLLLVAAAVAYAVWLWLMTPWWMRPRKRRPGGK